MKKRKWVSPCLIIRKIDGKGFRFLINFQEFNSRLKRKPVYIERIEDIIYEIGYFKYETIIDLKMDIIH